MFRVLFVISFLSLNAFATPIKLVDALLSEAGLSRILKQFDISGNASSEVEKYVKLSLRSLNFNDGTPSKNQLEKVLNSIDGSRLDNQYKSRLQSLMDSPVEKLSKEDLVNAINDLVYIANRFGNSETAVLGCARCVSDELDFHGFRFALNNIQNKNSQLVLNGLIPEKPSEVKKFISSRLRSFDIGDYSKVTTNMVAPQEEKSLALTLGLYNRGNKKQKKLIQAMFDATKNSNGEVDFLNPNNPHKLFLLFSEDMDDQYMDYWIQTLKKVKSKRQGTNDSTKEAFFEVLSKEAGEDPVAKEHIQMLRKKKCFFP